MTMYLNRFVGRGACLMLLFSSALCASLFAQAPAPEPLLITTVTANTIGLSWNDIYNDEDGFRLERYEPATGNTLTIAVLGSNVTTFLDTGLTPMAWYYYNVVAFNAQGDSQAAYTSAQATPVPAPEPLLINEITANTIRLSWNDIYNNEDGFRLERYEPATGNTLTIAVLGPNVTTFLDTGLTTMAWYYYNVVAFNSGGDSYPAYTSAQATPVPAPEPLLVNEITANTIRLSWNDIYNNEDGFRLERYDPATGNTVTVAVLGPNVTTFLDTGLTPLAWYYYNVVAFNSGGDSHPAYTSAQATPVPAPEPLLIQYTTANTIALSWNDIYNNEDGFRLERYDPISGNMLTIAILGPNVTTFLDTGLTPMAWYYYTVVAFNSGGDSFGAYTSGQATPVSDPGPLLVTSITANTIGLAWSDIYSDEDGFRLRRYDASSGNFVELAILGPNVTTFRDTGLVPGVWYYYEVVAFNSGGESYPANTSAQATPVPAPDPLIVTSSTATTIGLAWNDIYNDEDGFRLERSGNGIDYAVIAQLSANVTNFVDTGLMPEHFYYYRVVAFNSGGDSYYSATVSAGTTPVPAPDPLVVETVTATQIALSWNDIYSNEDGFRLERSTDSIAFTPVASLPANTTSHIDANLLPNTFYAYRVAAFNAGGDSYYSMTVNATTLPLPPFTPSGLSARAVSPSQIDLSWTDNSNNESNFQIERSPDGLNFSLIATVAAGTTSYSDTGLAESTQYRYRVRATNAGGNSDYSNQAATTTWASTPPAAPSNLTLEAISSSQINLSWQDNAGNEVAYFVEISTGGAFAQIAQLSANAQSYSATGLNSNTRYTFRVRCWNNAGFSGYSNAPNIKTRK
jgi:fibronectin type 3 domain-containing protein